MSITGRHDEAIAAYSRVLELDPISRVFRGHFGLILYRARRYSESIEQCEKALEIDPNYANALWFMALSLEQQGKLPEAIAKLEKAAEISEGPLYLSLLGRAYALAGDKTKALDILNRLKTPPSGRYVSPFDIAVVSMGLDDRTSSFQWLEEAYDQRVFRLIELTMPMFDNLRSDPPLAESRPPHRPPNRQLNRTMFEDINLRLQHKGDGKCQVERHGIDKSARYLKAGRDRRLNLRSAHIRAELGLGDMNVNDCLTPEL